VTDAIRVFVNATAVDVARAATALDCVRAWERQEGVAVAEGRRIITDSRGLPVGADVPVQAGSILRTIAARPRNADD